MTTVTSFESSLWRLLTRLSPLLLHRSWATTHEIQNLGYFNLWILLIKLWCMKVMADTFDSHNVQPPSLTCCGLGWLDLRSMFSVTSSRVCSFYLCVLDRRRDCECVLHISSRLHTLYCTCKFGNLMKDYKSTLSTSRKILQRMLYIQLHLLSSVGISASLKGWESRLIWESRSKWIRRCLVWAEKQCAAAFLFAFRRECVSNALT